MGIGRATRHRGADRGGRRIEMTEANVRLTKFNDADFDYSVSDDSMIGARMLPGDIVLVKQQDTVDNGDIALVYCNGEVRIGMYSRHGDCEAITPANDKYMTILSDINNPSFEIIGKAVAFMSTLGNGDDEASQK